MRNNKISFRPNLFLLLAFACLLYLLSFSQQRNLPLNRDILLTIDKNICKIDSAPACHSSFKPFLESTCSSYLPAITKDTSGIKRKLLTRKLFHEHLFIVNDSADNFFLTIDPLFNFEYGKDIKDNANTTLYKNTRGILVGGNIGQKFSFESSFLENQARFTGYIDDQIQFSNTLFPNKINYPYLVIPGQGRAKSFKNNSYDFAMAAGYVSYSPSKHFNFQAGTGKHFVGNGYRSLLLSDNAFNYPFLRITTTYNKLQYTNLYTAFMNLTDGGVTSPPGTERLFQKKAGSFQMLNWNINKRIQLGFFQGLIAQATDSTNKMKLHLSYANPILLFNSLVYGLSNENNILLGSTIHIKLSNSVSIYGQYMIDDIVSNTSVNNKNGFQAGVKYFDLFGFKNLHLQAEYNQVSPYSYSHAKPSQSYTHYNQALAHPLGANFKEVVGIVNYNKGRFFIKGKINYATMNKDSSAINFGNNIFKSDFIVPPASQNNGLKTTLKMIDASIGYIINPATNLRIIAGLSNRFYSNNKEFSETQFFYIGISTSLTNVYYDF